MKKQLHLISLLIMLGLINVQLTNAQTDVTGTYLTNAGFDSSPNYEATDAADNLGSANGGANIHSVTDWTIETISDNSAASSFEYGYAGTLNGQEVSGRGAVPAAGFEDSEGGALGISVAWGATVSYTQELTLPAGTYKIEYATYNSGPTAADFSVVAWIPDVGTPAVSPKYSFATGAWSLDNFTFVLTSETSGKIQVGLKAPNTGSDKVGRIFFDFIKIYSIDDASADNPVNLTAYLQNPSFENDFSSWNNSGFSIASNVPIYSKDGTKHAEKYTDPGNRLADSNLYQTLTGLPNGKYKIQAGGLARFNQNGPSNNKDFDIEGAKLYANTSVKMISTANNSNEVETFVTDGTLTVGVRIEDTEANWVSVDNFRLTFYGVDKTKLESKIDEALDFYDDGLGINAIDLNAAIITAQGVFNDDDATQAEVVVATKNLNDAIGNFLMDNASTANPISLTHRIVNADFEDSAGDRIQIIPGWLKIGAYNSEFCTRNDAGPLSGAFKSGDNYFQYYHNSRLNYTILQKITGLPNGKYVVTAAAGGESGTRGTFLFAGNLQNEITSTGNDYEVAVLVLDNTLEFGIRSIGRTVRWSYADNFRLSYLGTPPSFELSASSLFFDEANDEKNFTVIGFNLIDDIEFSGPDGISFSPSKVTPAEALSGKLVTVTWSPAVLGTKLDGKITVSSPDADSKTIDFITSKDSECADFLAPAKNLIDDPFFNNASQPGWGNHIRTSEEAYCGTYAGKVWATRGGSIDRPVTWKPETAYIIRAYVNTSGEGFVLGLGNAWVDGQKDNDGYNAIPDTEGNWELFENNFITGANAGSEAGLIWFNNYAANVNVTGYIDNLELYEARIVSFETGDGSPIDPIYVVKDEKLAEPETKKLGYLVKAWFTEEEFENEWDFETNVVNNNITLYAKWVVDPTTGINTLSDKIVKTEYFSLSGTQLDKINQDGLYIIKHIYNSGRTAILKQYIKLAK